MDDYTRKFSIVDDKDVEIYNILTTVYQALEEKGSKMSLTTGAASSSRIQ